MADEKAAREDKTLPASERKLRQARQEGQVARSRDFGHLMVMGTSIACLGAAASMLSHRARDLMEQGLRFDASSIGSVEKMSEHLLKLGGEGLAIVVPVGLAAMLGGVIAAVVPGGLAWSMKPLSPKWDRLDPRQGLARLFSRNHLVDSVKLALMVAALATIAALYLLWRFDHIVDMIRVPLAPSLLIAGDSMLMGALVMLLLLLVVALVDVPLQFFRHRAELRMTIQEARQEHKESEGDPHLRARIRERQRAIGRARMMAKAPTADVVITNPTHYAVALAYQDGRMRAPVVVAKGVDALAFRIRELATASGVPSVEVPALARALYAHVQIDAEVPEALYRAVAQVLAYVFHLKRHMPGTPYPTQPDASLVPVELDPARAADAEGV
ncbi:MAG: flagellar type III secretion system protein FlhB [Burkholderiaceae bacterium]